MAQSLSVTVSSLKTIFVDWVAIISIFDAIIGKLYHDQIEANIELYFMLLIKS